MQCVYHRIQPSNVYSSLFLLYFLRFLGYHQYLLPQLFHHYDKKSVFISCHFPFFPPWALVTTNLLSDSLCFQIICLSSLKYFQGSSVLHVLHIYPSLNFCHTSSVLTKKISINIVNHFWVLSWRRQYVKAMNCHVEIPTSHLILQCGTFWDYMNWKGRIWVHLSRHSHLVSIIKELAT